MSFISGLLGGGNILGTLLNVASMMFPAAQLASSLLNAFSGMMGGAIKGAIESLVKDGMPKFLGDALKGLVDQIFGGKKSGGSEGSDQAVKNDLGKQMEALAEQYTKQMVENVKEAREGGSGDSKESKGSGGKGGWLVALAKAFGKLADKAAKDLDQMGQKLNSKNPSEMIEYQARTQEFSQMMNTFINAIKTLGEAQTTAVRKG